MAQRKTGKGRKSPITKAGQKRVSAKISHLHKTEPGMPHKQMVGMSLQMEREHRLSATGAYKPATPKLKARRKK